MKIFLNNDLKKWDSLTIAKQQISISQLVDRAGLAIYKWLSSNFQGNTKPYIVLCGGGNNGADGLALSGYLHQNSCIVQVFIIDYVSKKSLAFKSHLAALESKGVKIDYVTQDTSLEFLNSDAIIVDAISGTGLNRDLPIWLIKLIKYVNCSDSLVIAIDTPSGLFLECQTKNSDQIVRANYTLSFQLPKLIFFLPQTYFYCGEWYVLDIDLDYEFYKQNASPFFMLDSDFIANKLKIRPKFSHKGTYGHSLLIGGSYGKMGAVILASMASLRVGAGLVTAYVPSCGLNVLQSAIPECMCLSDAGDKNIKNIKFDIIPSAIGIGMGMGTSPLTAKALEDFLIKNDSKLVLDADALNIIATHKLLLKYLDSNIITPHPLELKRLIGDWDDDFDKIEKIKIFSKQFNVVIVAKDAHTLVVYKDQIYINSTGNSGMATGGSGDVLTGLICGLISQGYSNIDAALIGVFLHGLSGDFALLDNAQETLIASDIINNLSKAFKDLL